MDVTEKIAARFVELIESYLAELRKSGDETATLREIDRRNTLPEYANGSCASHDFCDANVFMLEAFGDVTGAADPDICDSAVLTQMDASWNLTIERGFAALRARREA